MAAVTSIGVEAACGPPTWGLRFRSAWAGTAVEDSVCGAAGKAVGAAASEALAPSSNGEDAAKAIDPGADAARSSISGVMASGIVAGTAGAAEAAAMRAACIALPSRTCIATAEAKTAPPSSTRPSLLRVFFMGATGLGRWGVGATSLWSRGPPVRLCGVGAPSGRKAPQAAKPALTSTAPRAVGASARAGWTLNLGDVGLRVDAGPSSRTGVAPPVLNALGDATFRGVGRDSPRFVCLPLTGISGVRPGSRGSPAARSLTGGGPGGGSERPCAAPAMGSTSMLAAGCGTSSRGSGAQGKVSTKSVAAKGLMRPEPLSLGLASTLNPLVASVDSGPARASIVGTPANERMTELSPRANRRRHEKKRGRLPPSPKDKLAATPAGGIAARLATLTASR
jgi:hypothetical protein